jgi:hypothetical protein
MTSCPLSQGNLSSQLFPKRLKHPLEMMSERISLQRENRRKRERERERERAKD